jgi:hypothetical protein
MMLGAMANEQKQAEDRSVNPKPKTSTKSIVEVNEPKVDDSATDTPKAVDAVGSPVVDTKIVDLDGIPNNIQDSNHVPLVVVESVIGQPTTPSSNLEISETAQQKSSESDNKTKPHIEQSLTPVASSPFEASEVTPGVEEESKPQKNKGKKKKRKSTPKSDAGQSNTSLASKDSSETLKSSFMTESTENFVTALSSPNPSLTSGNWETCLCATNPPKPNIGADTTTSSHLVGKHQVDSKHSKTDSTASTGSTPTPKSTVKSNKKPRETHSKKGSNSSTISTCSVRKTDMKSTNSEDKTYENAKPVTGDNLSGSQKENQPSSLAVNLEDPTQWPSLGPAKTSSIVDGKPLAVTVLQPLTERKKNPNAPIIPVVPLNMQRRRPS